MSSLINHILYSLDRTDNYISNVTNDILTMEGMSGKKTRHFYNNICSMKDARYLEIGVWKGSSICASMCNNEMTCVCIDNWSEFGGPKNEFINNFNKYKGKNNASFIENDCWQIDVKSLGKFNIYMYDGNHTETSHFKALSHYLPCLENQFIYLVDDWNCESVRVGTMNSIKENALNILFQKVIRTTHDNSHAQPCGPASDWHNGISIFVLEKKL